MRLELHQSHPWNVTIEEAEQIQNKLRHQVLVLPLPDEQQTCITAIAAADRQEELCVGVVTAALSQPPLEIITDREKPLFPYHSGYLAFHQIPTILKALTRLNQIGDVIIVRGHGMAHPRRFGLASHLGVLLDVPTIGCAQGLLPGIELHPSPDPLIDWVMDAEGVVGIALYTQRNKKPWVLSIGHRINIESLLTFKNLWMKDHRLPEPLRLARRILQG